MRWFRRLFGARQDKFVAMADLVHAVRAESPDWSVITIKRTSYGVEFGHD